MLWDWSLQCDLVSGERDRSVRSMYSGQEILESRRQRSLHQPEHIVLGCRLYLPVEYSHHLRRSVASHHEASNQPIQKMGLCNCIHRWFFVGSLFIAMLATDDLIREIIPSSCISGVVRLILSLTLDHEDLTCKSHMSTHAPRSALMLTC